MLGSFGWVGFFAWIKVGSGRPRELRLALCLVLAVGPVSRERWGVSEAKLVGIAEQTGFQPQQHRDFVTLPSDCSLAPGEDLVSELGRHPAQTCPLTDANSALLELGAYVINSTNWYDLLHDGSKSFENG